MRLVVGDRVKLSADGIEAILDSIIRGQLEEPLRRRSCHNRKLTDFSVGTVLGFVNQSPACVRVKFDELCEVRSIAARFVRKTLRVLP